MDRHHHIAHLPQRSVQRLDERPLLFPHHPLLGKKLVNRIHQRFGFRIHHSCRLAFPGRHRPEICELRILRVESLVLRTLALHASLAGPPHAGPSDPGKREELLDLREIPGGTVSGTDSGGPPQYWHSYQS